MDGGSSVSLHYTTELEQIMGSEGEKCICYKWLHEKSETHYAYLNHWIALPVTVLSTITGASSIGSSSMFEDARIAGFAIGGVSLSIGVLNTIGDYFSFSKRSEGHRYAAVNYGKIYRFLQVELALPRTERMGAKDLLKTIREQIQRLEETSPQIPEFIIKRFKREFPQEKYPHMAMPELLNGLEPINIYNPDNRSDANSVTLRSPSRAIATPSAIRSVESAMA